MIHTETVISIGVYLLAMLGIGIYSAKGTTNLDEYLLGGRRLGPFVTALSAGASDMSAWLLLALPGAFFVSGFQNLWMVIGLFAGTFVNWYFVGPRLRLVTESVGAITLPALFESRFGKGKKGLLSLLSAIVIFFYFSVYVSSGLMGSALLFENVLHIPYGYALFVGSAVVLAYTILGGFLAVCLTDVVQGLMMVSCLLFLPLFVLLSSQDFASPARGTVLPLSNTRDLDFLGIVSLVSWGLGYFGQPHILVRFMAIKSPEEFPKARIYGLSWVFLGFLGAALVGASGTIVYRSGLDNPERLFIYLVSDFVHPVLSGVFLAAILAAVMSTVDSQLLVASSAVVEDISKRFFNKGGLFLGRLASLVIMVSAFILAYTQNETILSVVKYAWGGLGGSFSPLVLFSLFGNRPSYASAVLALVVSFTISIVWDASPLGSHLYGIVPSFFAGCAILSVSLVRRKAHEVPQQQ
jgi:sodium/proline symporter